MVKWPLNWHNLLPYKACCQIPDKASPLVPAALGMNFIHFCLLGRDVRGRPGWAFTQHLALIEIGVGANLWSWVFCQITCGQAN